MEKGKKGKILLVDDEPNILVALEFLLQNEGHEVSTAPNGETALEKITHFQPDVVVLDVMMPEMDGFEVARRIRKNPSLDAVRIVFLTAKGAQQDRFRGYSSGGEIYITKPFDNEDLVMTIRDVLEFG